MKSKKIKKQQLLPGIFISLAISFILFIYAPVELYCSNLDEFWFDFGVLMRLAASMFAVSMILLIVGYVILLLIHPVVYRLGLAAGLLLLVCTYVQGNFLITKLPPLDGTNINWNDYLFLRRESLLLWVTALMIIVGLLIFLKGRMFENVLMFISGCMTLMLLVTCVSLVISNPPQKESTQLYVTQKDEFTMSQNENFVILVLDCFDSREFTELLSDHPEYRETFADFTYFENMTAAYSCTKRSIPFILGGDWYENQGSFTEYMNGVYSGSPLFTALKERGYLIDLYEDELYTQDENALSDFDNIIIANYHVNSWTGLAKQELKLVGFRYAPFDLKRFCVTKKSGFDEEILVDCGYKGFNSENHYFKGDLEDNEIVMDDTQKRFKFIHLVGAHTPFIYDSDCNIIDIKDGTYKQNAEASITLATMYIDALKKSGAYDDTALIIMSDHGYNGDYTSEYEFMRQAGLFLVKGRGETHDTMQTSQIPAAYEDLPEAYERLMDGEESNGIFDWQENDSRERRFLYYDFNNDDIMIEYIQTGHAQDMTTMVPTGREFNR